jgi:hypothetical protein
VASIGRAEEKTPQTAECSGAALGVAAVQVLDGELEGEDISVASREVPETSFRTLMQRMDQEAVRWVRLTHGDDDGS